MPAGARSGGRPLRRGSADRARPMRRRSRRSRGWLPRIQGSRPTRYRDARRRRCSSGGAIRLLFVIARWEPALWVALAVGDRRIRIEYMVVIAERWIHGHVQAVVVIHRREIALPLLVVRRLHTLRIDVVAGGDD